jgi:hypothetical protein
MIRNPFSSLWAIMLNRVRWLLQSRCEHVGQARCWRGALLAKISVALVIAIGSGCQTPGAPRHVVILPDTSGSISKESRQQEFEAIAELANHLKRGDRLTIIPITSDADADLAGRIIRLQIPSSRAAYDYDLRRFQQQMNVLLSKSEKASIAHPAAQTDILGSIAAATQELHLEPYKSKDFVAVLSDFIQEDAEINFRFEPRLINKASARTLAARLAKQRSLDFSGAEIYLGLLKSPEYSELSRDRREAVQAFWIDYLKTSGAKVSLATDGPGLLSRFAGL